MSKVTLITPSQTIEIHPAVARKLVRAHRARWVGGNTLEEITMPNDEIKSTCDESQKIKELLESNIAPSAVSQGVFVYAAPVVTGDGGLWRRSWATTTPPPSIPALDEQAIRKIISECGFEWDETKSPDNALPVRAVAHTIRQYALAHMLDRIPTFSEIVSILQAYGAPLCQINCSLSNGRQVIAPNEWVVYIQTKASETANEKQYIDKIRYQRRIFEDGRVVVTIDIPRNATDENIRTVAEHLSNEEARPKSVEDDAPGKNVVIGKLDLKTYRDYAAAGWSTGSYLDAMELLGTLYWNAQVGEYVNPRTRVIIEKQYYGAYINWPATIIEAMTDAKELLRLMLPSPDSQTPVFIWGVAMDKALHEGCSIDVWNELTKCKIVDVQLPQDEIRMLLAQEDGSLNPGYVKIKILNFDKLFTLPGTR